MKKLFVISLALFASALAQAQFSFNSLTGGTPAMVSTTPVTLKSLTLTASTANNTTFKFWDLSDTNYTVVTPSYTSGLSYSTNWTAVTTNSLSGAKYTNTFSGIFTTTQTVAAATNTAPTLITIIVPASSQRTLNLRYRAVRGLAALADYNGIAEVETQ